MHILVKMMQSKKERENIEEYSVKTHSATKRKIQNNCSLSRAPFVLTKKQIHVPVIENV